MATFPGVLLKKMVYKSLKTEKETKYLRILIMDFTLMKSLRRLEWWQLLESQQSFDNEIHQN